MWVTFVMPLVVVISNRNVTENITVCNYIAHEIKLYVENATKIKTSAMHGRILLDRVDD